MVVRGTKTRSYQQLEELQGSPDRRRRRRAGAGAIAVSVETVRGSLPEVIALVGDLLRRPALAAKELEVVRQARS
jgi:hypothetical protein